MNDHLPLDPKADPGEDSHLRRAVVGGALGAAALAALASVARAGPLSPPPGPITRTAKPLAELEPRTALTQEHTPGDASAVFVINQPGPYYLTAHIVVPANKAAIHVAAPDVTIDLNGFTISGLLAAGTVGIRATTGEPLNLWIRNGTIEFMNDYGIVVVGDGPCRLSDLILRLNRGYGAALGPGVRMERVAAISNATAITSSPAGVVVGHDSTVVGCLAVSNRGAGIYAGSNVLIDGCIAAENTGNGINAGPSCIVTGCTARLNGGVGISLQHSGVIDSCTASGNTGGGITASFGSNVRDSSAGQNGAAGISVWEGSLIAGCHAQSNTGDGFVLAAGCAIRRSVAAANTGAGINAGSAPGSMIEGCSSTGNAQGIVGGPGCLAHRNHADGNLLGAGIQMTGIGSRVEDNLSCRNLVGIWVTAPRTLVARNDCAVNGINWNIAANCIYGPVFECFLSPVAMLGNGTGESTLGNSEPHANFTF